MEKWTKVEEESIGIFKDFDGTFIVFTPSAHPFFAKAEAIPYPGHPHNEEQKIIREKRTYLNTYLTLVAKRDEPVAIEAPPCWCGKSENHSL